MIHVLNKMSDSDIRSTILDAVSKKDFPREVAMSVLEASMKTEVEA